jgi:hypothetical protein
MMNENKGPIKDKSTIPKDWIKIYIFNYIDNEIMYMKEIRRRKIVIYLIMLMMNYKK